MTENPYARPQGTALTPAEERGWAVGTHAVAGIAMVVSAGTLGFIAALVVYLLYKDRGPFVRHYAANAVNIQLNALMWAIIIVVVGIFTLGLLWFTLGAIPFVAGFLHLLAALAANRGDFFNPPLTVRFIR